MAAPDTDARTFRTYGSWRRPRSPGVWGLGTAGTALLLGGAIGALITVYVAGLIAALLVALGVLVMVILLRTRDRHGKTLGGRIVIRTWWAWARLTRATTHRGGPVALGTFRLPGPAGRTTLIEACDAHGNRFGVVHALGRHRYTTVLAAEPDGASLVDVEQLDSWVAHFGHFLAQLGDEPGVVAAAITIETAPDSGSRLRREVETNLDPDAPELATAMLREVIDTYPAGSATVRAFVTVTFSGERRGRVPHAGAWRSTAANIADVLLRRTGGQVRDPVDVVRDIAHRLPALAHSLQATGAGAARPVSARELCEAVRSAYDPAAQDIFDAARATGSPAQVRWSDVGPAGADEKWDAYRHDGAWSTTWAMTGAPRGEVHARVLEGLLQPHPDIARKRVTLLYRPIDSGSAARIVENDRNTVNFLLSDEKRPSHRLLQERAMAEANAVDEAQGAGLVEIGLLVTATVVDEQDLDAARWAVVPLASKARVTLRPVYGGQAAAFAAALPIGVLL
jgi:hypothetical protein